MTRLKDSEYALKRIVQNNLNRPPNVPSKDVKKENELLIEYKQLISWMIDFCLECLFPGASFTRRGVVLNLLNISKELGFWNSEFHSRKNGAVLLSCLSDTYEENKALARNLLVEMPPEILSFDVSILIILIVRLRF